MSNPMKKMDFAELSATLVAIVAIATSLWLITAIFTLDLSPVAFVLTVLLLAVWGFLTWKQAEPETAGGWLLVALLAAVMSTVFSWIDCGVSISAWLESACLSRPVGFSLIITLCCWGYAFVCLGGGVRKFVLKLLQLR